MKKYRLEDLTESLKQMKAAMLVFESVSNNCYPGAYNMDRCEVERKRHRDRANAEAVAREEQNDCLVHLGVFIEEGAVLCCFGGVTADCLFYLFTKGGVQIAKGYTVRELIANIPKGE